MEFYRFYVPNKEKYTHNRRQFNLALQYFVFTLMVIFKSTPSSLISEIILSLFIFIVIESLKHKMVVEKQKYTLKNIECFLQNVLSNILLCVVVYRIFNMGVNLSFAQHTFNERYLFVCLVRWSCVVFSKCFIFLGII